MNDVLLTLSKSPAARNVFGALKLPIPLPELLAAGTAEELLEPRRRALERFRAAAR